MRSLADKEAPQSTDDVSLDPQDWVQTREHAHRMLDDILDYVQDIRQRPVWQQIPEAVRAEFRDDLPRAPQPLEAVHAQFLNSILPYGAGNAHPGFMGWVQGGGTVPGLLADMLAAGMNPNVGGRDQIPIEVERQITQWVCQMFGFPAGAGGVFVTGTSIANLMALLVAKTAAMGRSVRRAGLGTDGALLRGYASRAAHGCVRQAFDLSGLGSHALREIEFDSQQRLRLSDLRARVASDREAGLKPFIVVASAGTVDVGAIDDLDAIADFCREQGLWFHIDGAYGALGMLSPMVAPLLRGLEKADSIAFDFHKWGQVPYDAGFLLVRDGQQHLEAFAAPAAYLRRDTRGLAANSPWPCDFGPDLSRGFRALKTWFTLKTFGTDRLGEIISHTCQLGRYLEERVIAEPELELLAGAQLNIVCFRYRADDSDRINGQIVVALQESGVAAPSTTSVDHRLAIRVAIFNHRTQQRDIDRMIAAVIEAGRGLCRGEGR